MLQACSSTRVWKSAQLCFQGKILQIWEKKHARSKEWRTNSAKEVNHSWHLGWGKRQTVWAGWTQSLVVVLWKLRGLGRTCSSCNILQFITCRFLKWCHAAVFCRKLLQLLHPQSSVSQQGCWETSPAASPTSRYAGDHWLLRSKQQKEMQTWFICLRKQSSCCCEQRGIWAAGGGTGRAGEVRNLSLCSVQPQCTARSDTHWNHWGLWSLVVLPQGLQEVSVLLDPRCPKVAWVSPLTAVGTKM